MIDIVKRRWFDALGVFLGLTFAILATPLLVETTRYFQTWYDRQNPPAEVQIIGATYTDPKTIRFRFSVLRHRDCSFLDWDGYSGLTPNELFPASTLRREDAQQVRQYPIGVRVTSPPWVMSPIFGPNIMIKGYYDCNGRVVYGLPITTTVQP